LTNLYIDDKREELPTKTHQKPTKQHTYKNKQTNINQQRKNTKRHTKQVYIMWLPWPLQVCKDAQFVFFTHVIH